MIDKQGRQWGKSHIKDFSPYSVDNFPCRGIFNKVFKLKDENKVATSMKI